MFHTTQPQFVTQTNFVGAFQKPRPKLVMDCKGAIDHCCGKTLNFRWNMNPFPVWNFQATTLFLYCLVINHFVRN